MEKTKFKTPVTEMGDSKIKLPVVEAFYTIQGEGTHAGRAAFFIRLGGCDVGCHWCDVKESWELEGHPMYTSEELLKMVSGQCIFQISSRRRAANGCCMWITMRSMHHRLDTNQ